MNLRNRVTEMRVVSASELRANDANWRKHPQAQSGALSAMLETVGFVGAVLARELSDGTLELIDGHLRADLAQDAEIPVLVTDLTDEEAEQVLATYDPLSAAAELDSDAFRSLVGRIELPDHADLRKLVADLSFKVSKQEKKEKERVEHEVEGMPLRPHEHYDYVMVLASTTHDWNVLCERLGLETRKRRGFNSIGTCRAVRAEKLIALLPEPPKPVAKKKKKTTKKKTRRK